METNNWFTVQNGQTKGPFTLDDIKQMIQNSSLSPATLVWHEGFSQWQKAAETELAPLFTETDGAQEIGGQRAPEEWYLALKNGGRMGPLSRDEAILHVEGPETMVWHSGMPGWQRAGHSELAPYITIVEPAYGPFNNNIVWVAAVIPLVGIMLSKFLLESLIGPEELALLQQGVFPREYIWVIFVPLLIQTALGALDLLKLSHAGYRVMNLAIAMVLVFPLYLFLRARMLKTNYNYLIVYLICTAIAMFS